MATATFATRKDVVGFDRCNGIVDEHRGFQLRRQDVTGGHSFGYDFALCVEMRDLPLTDEQYLEEDRERMCRVIRQTPKTCLAFKILAASRNCATQQDVQDAFQYAFNHIKERDAVVVGIYPRHVDQVSLDVQYTLRAQRAIEGTPA